MPASTYVYENRNVPEKGWLTQEINGGNRKLNIKIIL